MRIEPIDDLHQTAYKCDVVHLDPLMSNDISLPVGIYILYLLIFEVGFEMQSLSLSHDKLGYLDRYEPDVPSVIAENMHHHFLSWLLSIVHDKPATKWKLKGNYLWEKIMIEGTFKHTTVYVSTPTSSHISLIPALHAIEKAAKDAYLNNIFDV